MPKPADLSARYVRNCERIRRARAALFAAEDALRLTIKRSLPVRNPSPRVLMAIDDVTASAVYGEGMGPDYSTLAQAVAAVTAEVCAVYPDWHDEDA